MKIRKVSLIRFIIIGNFWDSPVSMSKALILFVLLSAFLGQVYNQDTQHLEAPTCSSRVISLVPKTLKYHNEVNNTKELLCKSGSLPGFAILDERCYLIISPSATGDFPMSVDMTIVQRMADGSHTVSVITLSYILSISKIRYNGLSSNQEVEYDISVNRVINIETQSTSWFLKPGQQFFAQFSVNQTPKIFERVFFQFINLPHGLVGNELTGVIQGKLQVPAGYYSFAVRVFDMEGNSQTLEATILVHSEHDIFEQDDYEDQETLKAKLADVQLRMAENSATIARAKNNIEKKLEQISASRADLSDMNIQQRKLEGTQKSLAYAVNWAKGNLDTMKARFQSADQAYNDYDTIVNNAKRNYQTSVFAIQEKQSQIDKEQLQADRRFELYLKGDKNYTLIRLQLDECERRNQRISNDAIKNLKELDRANFVQNLYDIIQSK